VHGVGLQRVKGPVAPVANGRAGRGEERLELGVALGRGQGRRCGLGVVMGGQGVDLFDVEGGVAFQVRDFLFGEYSYIDR